MAEDIAIVTGGSRGIGAATALQLARNGFSVCVNYVTNKEAAARVVSNIEAAGSTAIAVQADVSSEADVIRLFETVDEQLGPLSALVNNAGIVLPQTRVEDMRAARIDRILRTNVTSYFLCCREAVRRMSRKHGGNGGAIVNVSSAAARLGSAGEYVDYAASKGAVDTLTRGLSLEVADEGIRVNCVGGALDGGGGSGLSRAGKALKAGRGGLLGGAVSELASAGLGEVTSDCECE